MDTMASISSCADSAQSHNQSRCVLRQDPRNAPCIKAVRLLLSVALFRLTIVKGYRLSIRTALAGPEIQKQSRMFPNSNRFSVHNGRLFAEVLRLIYTTISEYYAEAAGRALLTGLIVAHQT